MEDMKELGKAEMDLSNFFLSPSLPDRGPQKLAFASVCLCCPFS